MTRPHEVLRSLALLVVLATWAPDQARAMQVASSESPVTAFRDANVITMTDDSVRTGWTVVIHGSRVVAAGPDRDTEVPAGAHVIDARGRYLLPGLFDGHAHLDPEVGARPDFGEAPLYLAFGVTSVVSMKGDPEYLEIRDRVARGEILAPNLYTAGPFLDEPLINTAAEAAAAIEEQSGAGYDLAKLHDVYEYDDPYHFLGSVTYLTSHGVDQPTLNGMAGAARDLGFPAAGHIPSRLGLEGMLEAGLSLAHASILLGAWFWPSETPAFARHVELLGWGARLLEAAVVVFVVGLIIALVRRRRKEIAWLPGIAAGAILGTLFLARRSTDSYLWLGDDARVLAWSVAGFAVGGIALLLAVVTVRSFRARRSIVRRVQAMLAAAGALVIAFSVLTFWVPVLNRSTARGQAEMAREIADAGLWVQTTLSVEDTLVIRDLPELDLLDPRKARSNRAWADRWSPERVDLVRRGLPFFESVVGALHEAGVPLVLGTDAMGFPLVIPGVSVHDEMMLLSDAGLTPYEVLRTATVNSARFLGVAGDVGTIGVGRRADLLLVDDNPLENLATLRSPAGVMVGGRWLDRADLRAGLQRLADAPPPLAERVADLIEADGIEAASALFRERLQAGADPTFGPSELNGLGYGYLGDGQLEIAIRIFELNVEAFPEAGNPWDSLGEAYLAAGDRERSIAAYRRALELNPANDNARRVLEEELGVEIEAPIEEST